MTKPKGGSENSRIRKFYPDSDFHCIHCQRLPKNCALCMLFRDSSTNDQGCWIWNGQTTNNGYGRIMHSGRKYLTHRLILKFNGVDVPEGYQADHLCKNIRCFNPQHLEVVTAFENYKRSDNACRKHEQKVTCIYGHPFDLVLSTRSGRTRRGCSICALAGHKRAKERKRASKQLQM